MWVRPLALTVSFVVHLAAAFLLYALSLPSGKADERVKVSLKYVKVINKEPKPAEKPKAEIRRKPTERKIKKKLVKKPRRKLKRAVSKRKLKPKPVKRASYNPKKEKKRLPSIDSIKAADLLADFPKRGAEDKRTEPNRVVVGSNKPLGNNKPMHAPETEDKRERVAEYGEVFERENLESIRQIVSSNLRYPYVARRMGWEGTVILRFKLTPSGKIEEVSVLKSSGYEVLDNEALEALKASEGKLPKPKEVVVVELPIVYRLF